MVRSIEGHGFLMTRYPPEPRGTRSPLRVTTSAMIPGNGRVAEPGLVAMAPGSGVIMMAPVSVCHQVSTMGHLSLPMTERYHIHASGFMGSPTEPSRRRLLRSWRLGYCSPHLMNV